MPSNSNGELSYITQQNVTTSTIQTEYFDSFCGLNVIIPNETIMGKNLPYLKIIEQPADTFRYRYKSEKGSHGGIKGENHSKRKKSFPTVKMVNCPESCREKVIIRVSLYRNEPEKKLHVYELIGKNCANGNCEMKLNEQFIAEFSSIAILTRRKEEVYDILKERKISEYVSAEGSYDEVIVDMEVQEEVKHINLDSAQLCFEAFSTDDLNTPLCKKVFSSPVNNQKSAASGDLKIVRFSRWSGNCSGGDEVFLLCEKVKKEDIKVRFFEKPEEGIWEDFGDFSPDDVHHQVVIVFKTPKFYQTNVHRKVYFELFRPSDGKCSEPREFNYIPDDNGILNSLNKNMIDTQATSLVKNEFSEIFGKRKRMKLEKDYEKSECLLNSSVMYSPVSIDEDPFKSNNLGALEDFNIFQWVNENFDGDIEQSESLPPLDFNDLFSQEPNYVVADSPMNQVSSKMNSLSLSNQFCEKRQNEMQVSKDFKDGMNAILQNREAKTYLQYAPHLLSLEDENGNSMLHLAILEQNENLNLLMELLQVVSKDLINHQNKFMETPLQLAIKRNLVEILFLLLAKGADPNIIDSEGNNCLHLAAKYGHIRCLIGLISPPDHKRTWEHKIKDIDAMNYEGMSALQIAVTRNFVDCVTFLLKLKADVNLPEKKCGKTSLHLAIEHPSLMEIILRQPETDIWAKDFRGYTAVHLACLKTRKSFEIISAELEYDENKIRKFLENFNENCDTDSDSYSTDSSDFEDAVEELSLVSCNEVASKTVKSDELMFMKDKKSNLMKTEEALHKYLDTNENWKRLANLIDLNVHYVAMFDKESSPGQTVLRKVKDLYHPCDLKAIIEILQLAGLDEGVQILQKNS